ncbi:Wzz/FepE/Etk N-terminal domain-containing protein [Arsukibacterium indicum]|uniref:LPS O-antigen length regulator n=1 Tax=Arsukibacterium indicum TaxID=2848612 RepID=A0ABS6MHK4_9GAMM|nr:Wzz/FepE/Etk N-terminal domain-containing protein [Arsukibacterium indicum]MBV2127811.1 LPS O-antigen length regulator [Arsukibacterium indicum]
MSTEQVQVIAEHNVANQHANTNHHDEIGLKELFAAIWRAKFWLAGVSFLVAVLTAFYSLTLPNIYRSETLVSPVTEAAGGKLSSLAGQFGGIASLAGINLGSKDSNKTSIALQKLKSREFFFNFAQQYDVLVPLMAAKSWDPDTNKLILDSDIYDEAADKWVRQVRHPRQAKPSLLEAHETFLDNLTVNQDKESGMIKIMFDHVSPVIARDWVTALVAAINNEMRQADINEAQSGIAYLEQQIAQTKISEIQTVLYQLIEEQTKTLMLTNVKPEYVFETIDPPVVPELKLKPARALMVIGSAALAGILGVGIVLIRLVLSKE